MSITHERLEAIFEEAIHQDNADRRRARHEREAMQALVRIENNGRN